MLLIITQFFRIKKMNNSKNFEHNLAGPMYSIDDQTCHQKNADRTIK